MTKNAYFFIHHGDSSKQVLVVVYTKYELIPSIIRCHTCMQIAYPVFETLTAGGPGFCRISGGLCGIFASPGG